MTLDFDIPMCEIEGCGTFASACVEDVYYCERHEPNQVSPDQEVFDL